MLSRDVAHGMTPVVTRSCLTLTDVCGTMTHRHLALSVALCLCGAAISPSAHAQAPAAAPASKPATTTDTPAVLPPVVTVADPLMREIDRRIADSAMLASMNTRDRYLRLQSDNHYLEGVLKEQDKRIEQLEHRLAMLREQREKGRAESAKTRPNEDAELDRTMDRLDRLTATQTGTPAGPPMPIPTP